VVAWFCEGRRAFFSKESSAFFFWFWSGRRPTRFLRWEWFLALPFLFTLVALGDPARGAGLGSGATPMWCFFVIVCTAQGYFYGRSEFFFPVLFPFPGCYSSKGQPRTPVSCWSLFPLILNRAHLRYVVEFVFFFGCDAEESSLGAHYVAAARTSSLDKGGGEWNPVFAHRAAECYLFLPFPVYTPIML